MSLTRPLIWFISIFLLGLMMVGISQTSGATPLRDATQSIAAPLQDTLHTVFSPVADFVTNIGSYRTLRQQNQQLQAENQRLSVQVAQLQEQAIENKQLQGLARVVQQQPAERFATVSVVARDPNNLHDRVEIDQGRNAGIRPGMVVLGVGGALVGTVRETLANRSWVALLADSSSNVDAVIQQSRALAVARGSVDQQITLQFVAESVNVKVGDSVLTNQLGGHYPPGLLLGHVSAVSGQPGDLFKRITVEPAVRLDNLEHLLVLLSFIPPNSAS